MTSTRVNYIEILMVLASQIKNHFSALWITHRYEELTYADAVAELKNGYLSSWQKPSKFQNN